MKLKIVAILTAVIFVLQGFAFASYETGTTEDILTVSGTVEPFESVSFILLDAAALGATNATEGLAAYYQKIDSGSTLTTTEIFNFQTVDADANGNWSYTMPMDGITTKNLLLVPSIGEAEYIMFASATYREGVLAILKDEANKGIDYLSSALDANVGYITNKGVAYYGLADKTAVAEYVSATVKDIDATAPGALDAFVEYLNKAIHVCGVAEGKITDFDTVISIAPFKADHPAKITEEGKAKLVETLEKFEYTSVEDFCEKAKLQVALHMYNYNTNQTGDNLYAELIANNEIFGLDFTELNKLGATYQSEAAKKLAFEKVDTLSLMQTKLDKIVKEINKKPAGGSVIGNKTDVPENKPSSSSASISISNEYLQEQKYIYSDMREASWAADAVLFLSKEGVVSGYADNTFKPLNPITRAEFTKLVVETFYKNKEMDFTANFKDVSKNEWFSKYVNVAYNVGIISGDENGYFNPNAKITRQDMAVIVYNAGCKYGLFEKASNYNVFKDDAAISDYAKEAVYTLKNLSVINGVGEGIFAPNANADRASAAQILYSLMTNVIK